MEKRRSVELLFDSRKVPQGENLRSYRVKLHRPVCTCIILRQILNSRLHKYLVRVVLSKTIFLWRIQIQLDDSFYKII